MKKWIRKWLRIEADEEIRHKQVRREVILAIKSLMEENARQHYFSEYWPPAANVFEQLLIEAVEKIGTGHINRRAKLVVDSEEFLDRIVERLRKKQLNLK